MQELKGLNKLRQLIHAQLGGPAEYIMFGQEFGVVGSECQVPSAWLTVVGMKGGTDVVIWGVCAKCQVPS